MVGMRRALVCIQNVAFERDHTKEYPVRRIFRLMNYNLNFRRDERQWITFWLFMRLCVTVQREPVPSVRRFERCVYSPDNTTYFLFSGRITMSHVRMSSGLRTEFLSERGNVALEMSIVLAGILFFPVAVLCMAVI